MIFKINLRKNRSRSRWIFSKIHLHHIGVCPCTSHMHCNLQGHHWIVQTFRPGPAKGLAEVLHMAAVHYRASMTCCSICQGSVVACMVLCCHDVLFDLLAQPFGASCLKQHRLRQRWLRGSKEYPLLPMCQGIVCQPVTWSTSLTSCAATRSRSASMRLGV